MSMMRKSLIRAAILGAAAVGYMLPDEAAVASAACKACQEGKCNDVQGGATGCFEGPNEECEVYGDICNS